MSILSCGHWWAQRVKSTLPLPFFGLALWRAWMNLSFVAPNGAVPFSATTDHRLFDLVMLAAFAFVIPLAGRLSPLCPRRWAQRLCPVLMGAYALASAASLAMPDLTAASGPLTAAAALGATLMVLMWSELYAGLTPFKVLIGLTGSYAAAPVLVFLLNGLYPAYQAAALVLLPFASIACLCRAQAHVMLAPLRATGRRTVPWRVVAVMTLYGFASGLSGMHMSEIVGVNSSLTTFVVAGILWVGLLGLSDRISFGAVQKLPPALMVASLALVSLSSLMGPLVMGVCLSAAVLLSYFFVDATLCDISRRFGISAVWLFSITECTSMGAEFVGSTAGAALVASPFGSLPAFHIALNIALVVISLAAAALLLNRRGLAQHWGVSFAEAGALAEDLAGQERRRTWIQTMATQHRLSPREEEVLGLIAEGESMRGIAAKLTISEGTAKSHASHIYEKLGVSGKRALEELAQAALAPEEPVRDSEPSFGTSTAKR